MYSSPSPPLHEKGIPGQNFDPHDPSQSTTTVPAASIARLNTKSNLVHPVIPSSATPGHPVQGSPPCPPLPLLPPSGHPVLASCHKGTQIPHVIPTASDLPKDSGARPADLHSPHLVSAIKSSTPRVIKFLPNHFYELLN